MLSVPKEAAVVTSKHPIKEAPSMSGSHGLKNLVVCLREPFKDQFHILRTTRDVISLVVGINDSQSSDPFTGSQKRKSSLNDVSSIIERIPILLPFPRNLEDSR